MICWLLVAVGFVAGAFCTAVLWSASIVAGRTDDHIE